MIKGTVKFFNGTKGFGFITPDDGSKEVFVPSAAVTASGAGPLKAGQRVTFEAEQEAKGPKAVRLALLDEPLKEVPRDPSRDPSRDSSRDPSRDLARDQTRESGRPAITLYYETEDEDAGDVLTALSAAGHTARQIDYILNPPSREELKKLSVMLREVNQSLARRYEPLFMELQLDDRFISEAEFLTGIYEHPTLINGPILVGPGKARICRSAEDVENFLGNGAGDEKRPKGISPRMAAMMMGHAVPPAVEQETKKPEAPAKAAKDEKPEPAAKAPNAFAPNAPAPITKVTLKPRKVVTADAPARKPIKAAAAKPDAIKAKAVKVKAPAKPVKKAKK